MQIQIIDVGTPNTIAGKGGRNYQSMEVTYKGEDGRVTSKKLMSFSNPGVFKTISTLTKGATIDVVTQKDQAGYWQWTAINEGGSTATSSYAPNGNSAPLPTPTKVTSSTYETKEERAVRQRLIVRQSSLSSAIDILSVGSKGIKKEEVLALAEELVSWVFDETIAPPTIAKFDGDITEIESDIPY